MRTSFTTRCCGRCLDATTSPSTLFFCACSTYWTSSKFPRDALPGRGRGAGMTTSSPDISRTWTWRVRSSIAAFTQSHLEFLTSKLGITVVRHLSRLLRVIADYLQVSDGPHERCRLDVLEALSAVLSETWPRVSGHADDIMKSLVRLLLDIQRQADLMTVTHSAQVDLQRRALDCVQLLKKICPEYSELTDDFFSQMTTD